MWCLFVFQMIFLDLMTMDSEILYDSIWLTGASTLLNVKFFVVVREIFIVQILK